MRVNTGSVTFPNNSALGAYLRVKLSSGYLVVASDTEDELGTLEHRTLADEPLAAVVPREDPCVRLMVASKSISKYAAVYAAAGGKVSDTGTLIRGIALEAAGADGDQIRVLTGMASLVGSVGRSQLTEDALQAYSIPLQDAMVTATGARLGNTAGTPAGAFALTPGTHGTASPMITGETANNNSKTDKFRLLVPLPVEYVAAGDVKVRIRAKVGAAMAVAQTIAVTCYESDKGGGVSADLCATAAQNLSTSFANLDFTITATALLPGDLLDIEVTGVANDTGGTANEKIYIGAVQLLCDVKG